MARIAFIGLGEAGKALISGWGDAHAAEICAYDIKLDDPDTADEITLRCAELNIACVEGLAQAVSSADMVFCTVTADQAVAVAEAAAPHLAPNAYWLDLNSCAPSSKERSAKRINGAGGRYVDVAVMAPVYPLQNMVPLLVGGPHAAEVAPVLEALPMALKVVDGPVGLASSIKMIRSVFVKGMEALTAECTLAAAAAGVSEAVLPSLLDGHPRIDVTAHAVYNFERMIVHGERRAAELEEVAITLSDLGLRNGMSAATVGWERSIARAGVSVPEGTPSLADYTDLLLPVLQNKPD